MKIYNMRKLLAASVILLVISSCVKERGNNFALKATPTPNTVGFPNALESSVLNISNTPSIVNIYVEANSADNSNPAVTVTIVKNTAILAGSGYEPLPDSTYQLLNTTATVDPVTKLAIFQVKIYSNKIDLSHAYALSYSIASATGATIADNKKDLIMAVGVKNIYDGVYMMKGETLRAGDPGKTGHFVPLEMSLITFGAFTNDFSSLQVWADGTGVGIGIPRVTVDPSTNQVTVTSPGGAMNFPGYNNHYDPATKTFYIKFTCGAGPSSRMAADTLTYLRPR
jgi:hypothetical protein